MRSDTPTPGQCCYDAYCTGLAWRLPWEEVAARQQQRWEAAAQAVLGERRLAIDRDVLEHVLNCLANQKYLHEMAEPQRSELQAVIDAAWRKGMELLHGPPHLVDSTQEDTPDA